MSYNILMANKKNTNLWTLRWTIFIVFVIVHKKVVILNRGSELFQLTDLNCSFRTTLLCRRALKTTLDNLNDNYHTYDNLGPNRLPLTKCR